jgi:hypothetical protein
MEYGTICYHPNGVAVKPFPKDYLFWKLPSFDFLSLFNVEDLKLRSSYSTTVTKMKRFKRLLYLLEPKYFG